MVLPLRANHVPPNRPEPLDTPEPVAQPCWVLGHVDVPGCYLAGGLKAHPREGNNTSDSAVPDRAVWAGLYLSLYLRAAFGRIER
jgi:hypothetical protein